MNADIGRVNLYTHYKNRNNYFKSIRISYSFRVKYDFWTFLQNVICNFFVVVTNKNIICI